MKERKSEKAIRDVDVEISDPRLANQCRVLQEQYIYNYAVIGFTSAFIQTFRNINRVIWNITCTFD